VEWQSVASSRRPKLPRGACSYYQRDCDRVVWVCDLVVTLCLVPTVVLLFWSLLEAGRGIRVPVARRPRMLRVIRTRRGCRPPEFAPAPVTDGAGSG